MNVLIKAVNLIDYLFLKKQPCTRVQMRHQVVFIDGKSMPAHKYIDLVNSKLPEAYLNNIVVNHKENMRRFYMRFGLAGVKFYVRSLKRNNKPTWKHIL